MVIEVHKKKGEIVESIDGRHSFVELDGVVEGGTTLTHHDVRQMEVAMAPANKARGATLIQHRCRYFGSLAQSIGQCDEFRAGNLRPAKLLGDRPGKFPEGGGS